MRILIVEDERPILEGMRATLAGSHPQIEAILTADRAEDAIPLAEQWRPELLITDIVLPEMTGLELMQRIRQLGLEPTTIVVSGYSNFHYAQQSMQLGAIDYLLKPFDKEEFLQKALGAIRLIEQTRRETQRRRQDQEVAAVGSRAMRDAFLLGLCLERTTLQEHIVHKLRMWRLLWLTERPCYVIVLDLAEEGAALPDRERELLRFAAGNIAEELLEEADSAVLFRNRQHRWVILTEQSDPLSLVDKIVHYVYKYQKMKMVAGISRRTDAFQGIREAYEQAELAFKMARLRPGQQTALAEDLPLPAADAGEWTDEAIVEAVVTGRVDALPAGVEAALSRIVESGSIDGPGDLAQPCTDWIVKIHSMLRSATTIGLAQFPISLWEGIEACRTLDDTAALIAGYLRDISGQVTAPATNAVIEKAKRLIEDSFASDIGLQELAEQLELSPYWLSSLFKKETGQNFLDYVTGLRMAKAKELLRGTTMKIYEIAEAVGYKDLQHFGKLFKKRTGVTPKEYRYGK